MFPQSITDTVAEVYLGGKVKHILSLLGKGKTQKLLRKARAIAIHLIVK